MARGRYDPRDGKAGKKGERDLNMLYKAYYNMRGKKLGIEIVWLNKGKESFRSVDFDVFNGDLLLAQIGSEVIKEKRAKNIDDYHEISFRGDFVRQQIKKPHLVFYAQPLYDGSLAYFSTVEELYEILMLKENGDEEALEKLGADVNRRDTYRTKNEEFIDISLSSKLVRKQKILSSKYLNPSIGDILC